MKNIILIAFILCLTICSAVLMITTDSEEGNSKKHEKVAHKNNGNLEIKNQSDLKRIIYSNKDEQTKMNAYNEAVKKEIIPRSKHYQNAEVALKESLKIKKGK